MNQVCFIFYFTFSLEKIPKKTVAGVARKQSSITPDVMHKILV